MLSRPTLPAQPRLSSTDAVNDLASIRQVADHFAIPLSTLHYWERRGLLTPARRGGQRYYDRDQLYRIALIRLWRSTAHMSIDEIATILGDSTRPHNWRDIVTARITTIETTLTELATARTYLHLLLACPHDNALDHCEGFRAQVNDSLLG
ncbi:MerR family transcriptional regulator [Nocardia terpenica]|nr:MerR family transcriptional regulator [Nocardia terpenica]